MPSLYLLYRLDGHTVIPQLLKLEIKVIQPGNKLHFRRVSSDDNELLPEDSFDDKPAAVMLRSCLTKHLLKADILFRGEFEIIPVDSGICRCRASDPLFWTCHIVGCKVAWLGNATRPRRASTFRMPKIFSAYEGTARSPQVRRKIRGGKIFEKSMPNLRYGFRGWVVSLCNITTMRACPVLKKVYSDW